MAKSMRDVEVLELIEAVARVERKNGPYSVTFGALRGELERRIKERCDLSTAVLSDIAGAIAATQRLGNEHDSPEGSRYLHMSDTFAKKIEQALLNVAGGRPEYAAPFGCRE